MVMSSSCLLWWNWLICNEVPDTYADATPPAETQEETQDKRHMATAIKDAGKVLWQNRKDFADISIFIMPGMFVYFGMIQGEFKVLQRQFIIA
jgi:hypothetical protein